jgi:hypothetical protein
MAILRIGHSRDPKETYSIASSRAPSAICGKISSSTVVITIDSMRMLVPSAMAGAIWQFGPGAVAQRKVEEAEQLRKEAERQANLAADAEAKRQAAEAEQGH